MHKKIVVVVPTLGKGGAERSVMNFIHAIEGYKGLQVTLLVLNKLRIDIGNFAPPQTCFIKTRFLETGRAVNPLSWIKLYRAIQKESPDMVIGWSNIPGIMVAGMQKWLKTKLFVSERDATIAAVNYHKTRFTRLLMYLQKKWYPRLDGIIFNSTENLRMYKLFLLQKRTPLFYLPNMLELADMGVVVTSAKAVAPIKKILFVGRLEFQKGLDVMFRALPFINLESVELIVVGHGSMEASFKQQVSALPIAIQQVIHWKGKQASTTLFYQEADLLVFPSRHEGYPNVLMEAMLHELPVVASDCYTGPRELTDRGQLGTLFKNEDSADLAQKVNIVLANLDHYKTLAIKAKDRLLKQHHPEVVKNIYCQFIEKELFTKSSHYV
jgi:glycosyltransferase involved in cell wall biosynthesis